MHERSIEPASLLSHLRIVHGERLKDRGECLLLHLMPTQVGVLGQPGWLGGFAQLRLEYPTAAIAAGISTTRPARLPLVLAVYKEARVARAAMNDAKFGVELLEGF